jgi:predicted NAD/FAD-dependent oxidoreductase
MKEVMHSNKLAADALIIGAGMTGLTAAVELQRAGLHVVIVDKGRGVGGRIASRRIGGAAFDHGAQFMTGREPRFAGLLEEWRQAGLVMEWGRGFAGREDGHSRWRGNPAMTAVAKRLAQGIEVVLEKQVIALRRSGDGWSAETATGKFLTSKVVLLTPPVPQSLAMLDAGGITIPPAMRERLEGIEYERCLAVMAVLDGPSRIPPPGGLALDDAAIAWLADNQMKGISLEPAVTIHASHGFSLQHWEGDRLESGRGIIAAAGKWLGARVKTFQVHGWRYSKPMHVAERPLEILHESPMLVLAGDAFAAPRVEGAAVSGWAAADAILHSKIQTRSSST